MVDHAPAGEPMLEAREAVLRAGAQPAFHDYVDTHNLAPKQETFTIVRAIADGLDERFARPYP